MRAYIVGGAVRDELLGLPVKDRDWVVVGATPEHMVKQGFRPVGKDFPVFLHPHTQEEYALARTERKTAPGYHGFVFHTSPEVRLEDDLVRRDLTINAMARAEDGAIVDPYGGLTDLRERIFRHVSDAFAEDPVRILRLARFAARFAEFRVADSTMALMRAMVDGGEVDALVPERVWQELSRGLMERTPSRMLAVLRDCGALARILPELHALWGVAQPHQQPHRQPPGDAGTAMPGIHVLRVIDDAAARELPLAARYAAAMLDLEAEAIQAICQRLRVPGDCRDLAVMTAREQTHIADALALSPQSLVTLFERCDGFRKPERFIQMLLAAECAMRGDDGAMQSGPTHGHAQRPYLSRALDAARAVNAGAVAARFADDKARIPQAVHAARVDAVAAALALRQD